MIQVIANILANNLTYSSSLNDEHATAIAGNRLNPGLDDVLRVADAQNLSATWAKKTALKIEEKTKRLLDRYGV